MEELAKQLDSRKRKIEITHAKNIKRELNNIASIAGKIYSISGRVNGKEVSQNAKPEIVSAIRKLYSATQTAFSRDLRDRFTGKKQQEVVITQEQNQSIQQEIDKENLEFVNNRSEEQAELILETTAKQIDEKTVVVAGLIASNINNARQRITELNSQISELDNIINNAQGGIQALKDKKKALEKELSKTRKELSRLTKNTNSVVGKEITKTLKELNVARSQLIAEQEVGLAESQVRFNEAQALNRSTVTTTAGLAIAGKIRKVWSAILDGKTRDSHQRADGQTVRLNETFIVGGVRLRFSRDPLAPIREIIRCRCVIVYEIDLVLTNWAFYTIL